MCVCVGGGGVNRARGDKEGGGGERESTGSVGTTMGGKVRGTGDEKGVVVL